MDYTIGSRIGDYEILSILGAGGMGKVYKVRNLLTERQEAMKVLLMNAGEEQDQADRFLREIKVQARLTHKNIAGLHTALRVENQVLMVMEYVEGTTLERLLKMGPVPPQKAAQLMCQVLDALAYAHEAGVVHRDLKPANIMMTTDGVVKLLDFGIAKLKQDQSLTKTGFTVGSLPYMSPEQIEGATDLDQRADIYALGISLYEMVTGRRPFLGDSDYSLMVAHLKQIPVPPIEIDPNVPQGLNDIILTAIAKDREKRFQSAGAMLRAMQSILGDAAPAVCTPAPVATSAPVPDAVPTRTQGAHAAPNYGAPPPAGPSGSAFMPAAGIGSPAPEFPAPPVAPVPVGKPLGHRGLYIALGSLVTVVVLVAAAMQIPKYFKTQAEGGSPQVSTKQEPVSEPPQVSQPPAAQPTATETQTPQTANPQAASTSGGYTPPVAPAGGGRRPHSEVAGSQAVSPVAHGQTAGGVVQNPPVAPPPVVQQPAGHPAVDANEGALREARESLMLLGTRANTVKSSLSRLKQEQARQGLGLRGDINTAEQQMEYYLDECEGALKRGDLAGAKKYLGLGERTVTKLEEFLGR